MIIPFTCNKSKYYMETPKNIYKNNGTIHFSFDKNVKLLNFTLQVRGWQFGYWYEYLNIKQLMSPIENENSVIIPSIDELLGNYYGNEQSISYEIYNVELDVECGFKIEMHFDDYDFTNEKVLIMGGMISYNMDLDKEETCCLFNEREVYIVSYSELSFNIVESIIDVTQLNDRLIYHFYTCINKNENDECRFLYDEEGGHKGCQIHNFINKVTIKPLNKTKIYVFCISKSSKSIISF